MSLKKVDRIVFMGTPEFAVETLKALVERTEYNIVGVITAPDKPAGRGKKINESAVKQYAESQHLKILQPTNLKNETFQKELKALNADIQVVVAFRMLPESVWNMPPLGSINLHGSLLPNYRGAAPIHWAIINGEKETGVSTFFLQHEIDTGKIIQQAKVPIKKNDTVGIIYEKLMKIGADLVVKTLDAVNADNYTETEQAHIKDVKHAPKIFKETCKIDWNNSSQTTHNFIRGLSPFPCAWTILDETMCKIYLSQIPEENFSLKAGEIKVGQKRLFVGCSTGIIEILELQLAGKKRMKAAIFLNGYNIKNTSFN